MQCNYIFPKRSDLHDLCPIYVGCETCAPSHAFGPAIRDFTIIHYVKSGRGKFTHKETTYDIEAGDAFVIVPGEVTYYIADENEPWEYFWVSFGGTLADKFSELPSPVIKAPADIFIDPVTRALEGVLTVEYSLSKLFLLYGNLFSSTEDREQNIPKRVARYIRHNYMEDLSVESLADMINLDRRYLSRIFKEELGVSIMPYIISVRCAKAKEFLEKGYNVKQTATMVGYGDAYTFSKMFKRQLGLSPSDCIIKTWDWHLTRNHSKVKAEKHSVANAEKKSKKR